MPTTFNPTVELLNFEDLLEYAANNLDYAGQTELLNSISAELRANPYRAGGLTTQEAWANEIAKKLKTAGYEVQYNGNGAWTGSVFSTEPTITTMPNPIDSNVSTVSRGNLRNWYGGLNELGTGGAQTWVPTRFPVSGGLGSQALYLAGSIASGVGAVSTGIWLGKTVDSALYNAFPDFWDSAGMSALNPETWNTITIGSDSPFAGLFNFILGLDPDTGKAEAYMSEDTLAYLAYYWKTSGALASESSAVINSNTYVVGGTTYTIHNQNPAITQPVFVGQYRGDSVGIHQLNITSQTEPVIGLASLGRNSGNIMWLFISKAPFSGTQNLNARVGESYNFSSTNTTVNNDPVSYYRITTYQNNFTTRLSDVVSPYNDEWQTIITPYNSSSNSWAMVLGWTILYDGSIITGGLEGIGDQPNATIPDTSTWEDIPSTLQSLQNQYPDAFANPMVWNSDSPTDSTAGNLTRYIPVPFPEIDANGNPISASQTQTSTEVSPSTSTQTLLDLIMDYIQQTQPATETQPTTPPQNPVDTGTGGSPTPIPPSGSASALWSVYHPTQAQVNAFGAWLWSNDFVDQLLKVFQNPMDAIISLHKVFISPVDAGSTTIHAGYLDSEVPSNYVTQQYVYKDCGYVNCYEVFGNVFDYVGTSISLYLPFIGIVPLNVDEVMRSTIHVTYGCDLFTGAILVQVEISRDGNDVVMYQYGGDGGVQYPVSGSRSGGFLTGLVATIGAAASIATGGATLPAFAAAFGGSVMSAQKQVQHSGGFSGNSGAMGGKIPYLIIERPQTKVAELFPSLSGYPTNKSGKLSEFEGQVVVSDVHVEGMTATDTELSMIEDLLKEGVLL